MPREKQFECQTAMVQMKPVDGSRIDERRQVGESRTIILASGCARPTREPLAAHQWIWSHQTILHDLQSSLEEASRHGDVCKL